MRRAVAALAVMVLLPSTALSDDCNLGAYYFRTFENAGATMMPGDRIELLERTVAVCSRWQYWQQLGEAAEAMGDRALTVRAAEAYARAYAIAATPLEQAQSAGRYAQVLLASGDPQRALVYVHHARNLMPEDPWLNELAARVNDRVATATPADITRGLGDALFKPLVLHRVPADVAQAGGAVAQTTRAINVPIRFEVNSSQVSEDTRRNLAVLAATLANPQFTDDRFILIGHADQRGGADHNLTLSIERAQSVRRTMVKMEPALAGRLSAAGLGESKLLSTGNNHEAHQINRRLEVVIDAAR